MQYCDNCIHSNGFKPRCKKGILSTLATANQCPHYEEKPKQQSTPHQDMDQLNEFWGRFAEGLRSYSKILWLYLWSCYPDSAITYLVIQGDTGMASETVRLAIRQLVAEGLLDVKQGGPGTPSSYTLLPLDN